MPSVTQPTVQPGPSPAGDLRYRLAFDLEMNQPSGRIIQIGAVVGNMATGEIVERLSVLVKPGEPLSPAIVKLTGITDAMLEERGVELMAAYTLLSNLKTKWSCSSLPLVWNAGMRGNDVEELAHQMREDGLMLGDGRVRLEHEPYYIFTGWRDVKGLYQEYCEANDIPARSGLAKSLLRAGLLFEGRPHDALFDALNTFCLGHFLNRLMVDHKAVKGKGRPLPPPQASVKSGASLPKSAALVAQDLASLISREG